MACTYPGRYWERLEAADAGVDPERLNRAKKCFQDAGSNDPYRVVVIRYGRIVAEWSRDVASNARLPLASANKSILSCVLGIAIREGRISSADAKVIDYYPEAMMVPEGKGPKEGRYVREKDHAITMRQLISNTSGYMKPNETPGEVFHYQTFGMTILQHAIAKAYGYYDIRKPEGSPGLRPLIDTWLRSPIGARWGYYKASFDSQPGARQEIFDHRDGVETSALDMARLGWLWCNWGSWRGTQLIPEAWMREATRTARDIRDHCPEQQWKYGYGFWTNDHGKMWPGLPRDSFAARGAGNQRIWVCPSLSLVVVESPGFGEEEHVTFLDRIVGACSG